MSERVRLGIVIPAYNEEERLPRTLARIAEYYGGQSYTWRAVVVSDGSTDGTNALVRAFAAGEPRVELLALTPNRGKGAAVRAGMLGTDADLLLFCDADLATPQEETEKLLGAIEAGADVAIGSRPLRDSALEVRQPFYREMLGRAFNKAVQTLGVRGIDDTQCGFKMFRRDAAREVFSRCKIDGFGFDFESLMIARDLGPRDRRGGGAVAPPGGLEGLDAPRRHPDALRAREAPPRGQARAAPPERRACAPG